jgi:hypothetical protein
VTIVILSFDEADSDPIDIAHIVTKYQHGAAVPARLRLDQRQACRQGKVTMSLHDDAFEYLEPSDDQVDAMQRARTAAKRYADAIEELLPDGADKTYILRRIREIAMWVNAAITREADGSPRIEI